MRRSTPASEMEERIPDIRMTETRQAKNQEQQDCCRCSARRARPAVSRRNRAIRRGLILYSTFWPIQRSGVRLASVGTRVTATHPAMASASKAELAASADVAEFGGCAGIDREKQRDAERDDGEEKGADGGAVGFGPELCEGGGGCMA